jgi:NADPH:quinone reductase-like Zn-dependent oxidoreductase
MRAIELGAHDQELTEAIRKLRLVVVVVYGMLANAPCGGIDPGKLVFENKRIENFWLTTWLQPASLVQRVRTSDRVQKLMSEGVIKTSVRRRIKLKEVTEALLDYQAEMGRGKVLIMPAAT